MQIGGNIQVTRLQQSINYTTYTNERNKEYMQLLNGGY